MMRQIIDHPEDAIAFAAAMLGLWLILHMLDRVVFGLMLREIL